MIDAKTKDDLLEDQEAAIRERYRRERAKRIRPEGNDQYINAAKVDEHFDNDPFAPPVAPRDPVIEDADVVIIGGGIGGMMAAVHLHKAGITNVRLIEKAADFGGTWYWNRYPGAACDVEAYSYLPLLEETGYIPTERYAKALEIQEHCQRIARQFDLYPHALFQTLGTGMAWNDDRKRWLVTTNRGDEISARYIINACGGLHKPKLPRIPGIETFQGHSFHTTRWDYAYTGGSSTEPLTNMADKVVGIIGTGATAVQVIPRLAKDCKHLYIFQRTPAGVAARDNRPTDPAWAKSLQPGWQAERMENFTTIISGIPYDKDLIDDGWVDLYRGNHTAVAGPNGWTPEDAEAADLKLMADIRARVDTIVEDKATAEALKPWYNRMCKRPCFHDEYLPTFNRPNVTLVDTEGRGIDRMTETGVVVGDTEYPIDCMVYASGFETAITYIDRLGFDPVGRGGVTLSEAWADGPATLHGMFSRGFPNMLLFNGAQGSNNVNYTHIIMVWAKHAAWLLDRLLKENVATIEPSEEAQEAWWQEILKNMPNGPRWMTPAYQSECTPSYFNNEGKSNPKGIKSAPYNAGMLAYAKVLGAWREADDLNGLEVTYAESPQS